MRAGPLSNAKVIALLNQYFVPVHVDGVYLQHNEKAPAEEKAAYRRVFQAFAQLNKEAEAKGGEKTSIGTVHAYILTSDGRALDSMHVAQAKPERVIDMLERAVRRLKVPAGKTLVKPAAQSAPPKAAAGSLTLHLTARYLVPRQSPNARQDLPGEYVPIRPTILGTERSGNWSDLPSENWIVLKPAECRKLLPAGDLAAGKSWDVDRDVAAKLFRRFYPDTEANDLSENRIDRQALRAKVVSVQGGVVRVRLDGELKMKHAFYPHREDNNFVEATVAGYLDYQSDKREIRALRLVTDQATYGSARQKQHFGVAVRSQP